MGVCATGIGLFGREIALKLHHRAVDFQGEWVACKVSLILFAATSGSSCAQTRTTNHPASCKCWLVSESRCLLRSIFSRQNSELALACVPCMGHPCQKQPSTNTATFSPLKRISAFLCKAGNGWSFTAYAMSRASSAARSANSAFVPCLRTAFIRLWAASEDDFGVDE